MRGSSSFSGWFFSLYFLLSFAKHRFLNRRWPSGPRPPYSPHTRRHKLCEKEDLARGLGNIVTSAEVTLQPFSYPETSTKKLENNPGTNSHVILQPVITLSQTETSEEPLPGLDCNRSDDGNDH